MHRVEFWHLSSTVLVNINRQSIGECNRYNVGSILEKVSKRLFNQYADGCTIFEMTDKQVQKLKQLIK